jgi:hypothetical protein
VAFFSNKIKTKKFNDSVFSDYNGVIQEINDSSTTPERAGALVKGLRKFVKVTDLQKDKKVKQHKLKLRNGESLKMPEGGRALALSPCPLDKQKEKLEELKNSLNSDPTISQKKKNRWNAVFNENKVIFLTAEQMEIADREKDEIVLALLIKLETKLNGLLREEQEQQTKSSETTTTSSEQSKIKNHALQAVTSSFVNKVMEKNLGHKFLSGFKKMIKFFENERREQREKFENEMKAAEEYNQLIRDIVKKEDLKVDLEKVRIKTKEVKREILTQSELAQER